MLLATTAERALGLVGLLPYLLAALFTAALCYAGVRNVRTGLAIREQEPVPTAQVGTAADGATVAVEGTARVAERTLEAPLTGTGCLAYEWYSATDFEPNSASSDYAETGRETAAVPFRVEDDAGRVAVDPSSVWLALHGETVERTDDGRERERRLDPGDRVHVYAEKRTAAEAVDGLAGVRTYLGPGPAHDQVKLTQGEDRRPWVLPLVGGALVALVSLAFLLLTVRGLLGALGAA